MGGATFTEIEIAEDAATAFSRVVDQAGWEHGHGGYSGTIAEKHEFRALPVPALPDGITIHTLVDTVLNGPGWDDGASRDNEANRWEFRKWEGGKWVDTPVTDPALAATLTRIWQAVDDKWGPAGCFDLTDTPYGVEKLEHWLDDQRRTGAFRTLPGGKQERVGPEPTTVGKRVFMFFGWASS